MMVMQLNMVDNKCGVLQVSGSLGGVSGVDFIPTDLHSDIIMVKGLKCKLGSCKQCIM